MHPDIEVLFSFNGTKKRPVTDGYRPAHLVKDNNLTTGVHHYYCNTKVAPDSTVKGTITFISPENYPHSLWAGKTIKIQEGERVVGEATVLRIFNPILCGSPQK